MFIMSEDIQQILLEAKSILVNTFGFRLSSVVLYGSEARGQADPDSDIDLLVVFKSGPYEPADSRLCVDVLYPLVLRLGRPIHAMPVNLKEYLRAEFPLYRNAQREGIAA